MMHTYKYDNEFSKNSKFRWDFHYNVSKLDRWEILHNKYDRLFRPNYAGLRPRRSKTLSYQCL